MADRYADALFITATGTVSPTAAGAAGVVGTGPGVSVTNMGDIVGGNANAADGYISGTGVSLVSGNLTNAGTISGGGGCDGPNNNAAPGGIGVVLTGGTITNSGTIKGGAASNCTAVDAGG